MESYSRLVYSSTLKRRTNAEDTPLSLTAATGQYAGYGVLMPLAVRRVLALVTTQVTSGTTAAVVSVTNRPTFGSASGATTVTTMTIPNGATVGTVVYKDISDANQNILAGNELSLNLATAAADAVTAGGAVSLALLYEPAVDADADQVHMVKGV